MNPFKAGSRVTFLGDSITAANYYCAYIADYYAKNLPELKVSFSNAGIGGATVSMGIEYLEENVYSNNPDCVTIMYGVNDSGRDLLSTPDTPERNQKLAKYLESFKINMLKLINRLQLRGIDVVLFTPVPYAEYIQSQNQPLNGGYALILHYAECVRKIAKERNLPLVDLHARISELYKIEPLYSPDHVHPYALGHMRMAQCILQSQGLDVGEFALQNTHTPLSPKVKEWHDVITKLTDINFAEAKIIHNQTLTTQQKLEFMRGYIAEQGWSSPTFEQMARKYMELKPMESQLKATANVLMDKIYEA